MIDKPLFLSATALIVIGIIFSYSLSVYTVLLFNVQPWHFFIRQLAAGMIGIFLMWFIARQDPDKVTTKIGFSIFIISALMMIAIPFLPESIAREVGGAKRWIRLGPLSLAPVEFFKIGFAYFIAWSFSRKVLPKHIEKKEFQFTLKDELLLLLPYFVIFAAVMFIIAIFQNDLGQVVLLAATLLGLMIFAGSSLRFFGASILVGSLAITGFIVTSPHRIERFKGWYFMLQNSIAKIFPQWASAVLKVNLAEEPYQISNSLHQANVDVVFKNPIELIAQALKEAQK